MMRTLSSTAAMLAFAYAVACAQPDVDEVYKAARPGPSHQLLKAMTGRWKYTLTSYMDPAKPATSTGTAKGEMMLGGRFLKFETSGKMLGMSASTFSLLGFDNRNSRYFVVECDELGTYTVFAEGLYDEATRTMTLRGENEEQGLKLPFRFIYRFPDRNRISFSIIFEVDGREQKTIDMEFRRG